FEALSGYLLVQTRNFFVVKAILFFLQTGLVRFFLQTVLLCVFELSFPLFLDARAFFVVFDIGLYRRIILLFRRIVLYYFPAFVDDVSLRANPVPDRLKPARFVGPKRNCYGRQENAGYNRNNRGPRPRSGSYRGTIRAI